VSAKFQAPKTCFDIFRPAAAGFHLRAGGVKQSLMSHEPITPTVIQYTTSRQLWALRRDDASLCAGIESELLDWRQANSSAI